MPEWPPKDMDYAPALKAKSLRKVDLLVWKLVPEEENGLKKVFEISGYPGLFKNEAGDLFDVRPRDSCPSHDNLMKKSTKELATMLVTALKNQCQELKNSEHCDNELLKELQKELGRAEKISDTLNRKK